MTDAKLTASDRECLFVAWNACRCGAAFSSTEKALPQQFDEDAAIELYKNSAAFYGIAYMVKIDEVRVRKETTEIIAAIFDKSGQDLIARLIRALPTDSKRLREEVNALKQY